MPDKRTLIGNSNKDGFDPNECGSDNQVFRCIFEQLDPNNSCSFPYFLGFLETENIALLKAAVTENNILASTEILEKEGLLFEKHSKALSLQDTQTLMLEYKKNENNFLETSINNTIKSAKLGSRILVSTKQYFSLILIQPCSKCNNNVNKSWNIVPIGFQNKSTIESAAGLAEGISRNAIQTSANSCTKEALQKCIEYTLLQDKKSLAVRFDCSWSYVQNENQTSRELIFQEIPSTRLAKNDKGDVKTIHQGNFDNSLRQIEHAILIEVLRQISLSLEETDLHLEICINNDLDSNKTLANISIKKKIQFHTFEDHIMHWFHRCIYSAILRKAAQDSFVLTEEETCIMQIEELIYYLQNDHTQYWSDVCWTKDNPEISLQEPTLCHSSNSQTNEFRKLLETIYLALYDQRIVTLYRTLQNEAFNRVKLVYVDKKIDY
ncbi:18326_t:CDS:2 [Gigaspora margarita]|uniref:18326_t:CDS:1 n=1 Tax=Gigaspora margarita TaxID=4874 RepID=A0ABN7VUZ8_GIGMA|nr:18326_t:CDS:2 [Gigaspora margarita]